jgi:hypothetical protein
MIVTNFLNTIQDHTLAKLLSEPLLQYVSIASQRHQVKLDVTARKAPHLALRNGKTGAGLLIGLPIADPDHDRSDIPGAQMVVKLPLDVLVKDDISLVVSNGAGITAEQIVVIAWLLLNQLLNKAVGSGNWYVEGFDPIEDQKGAYGYRLILAIRAAQDQPPKVSAPIVTFNAGMATITGDAGANLYFTTDGTFPGPYAPPAGYPANTSTLYAAPFAVVSGTVILVAGYLPNSQTTIGSDVWSFIAP